MDPTKFRFREELYTLPTCICFKCKSIRTYSKLGGGFQDAEVRGGGDPVLQRLQEHLLKLQHLWQASEQ